MITSYKQRQLADNKSCGGAPKLYKGRNNTRRPKPSLIEVDRRGGYSHCDRKLAGPVKDRLDQTLCMGDDEDIQSALKLDCQRLIVRRGKARTRKVTSMLSVATWTPADLSSLARCLAHWTGWPAHPQARAVYLQTFGFAPACARRLASAGKEGA